MRSVYILLAVMLCANILNGQEKKIMDPSVYEEWKSVKQTKISNNGNWVSYEIEQIKADPVLHLYNTRTKTTTVYPRGSKAGFDFDNQFLAFMIQHPRDSIRSWKSKKIPPKKFKKDTLVILDLDNMEETKIPHVDKYVLPEKWGSLISYRQITRIDSSREKSKRQFIVDKNSDRKIMIEDIIKLKISKESPYLLYAAGNEKKNNSAVYFFDVGSFEDQTILEYEGKCLQLAISDRAGQAAIMINSDTLNLKPVKPTIFHFDSEDNKTSKILDSEDAAIGDDMVISKDRRIRFNPDASRIFFGIKPTPAIQDSTLLEEDIVQLDVWSSTDQTLYTQQAFDAEKDRKKSLLTSYDLETGKLIRYGREEVSKIQVDKYYQADNYLGVSDENYQKYLSWLGYTYKDLYLVNAENGSIEKVATMEQGSAKLSPSGKYSIWFNKEEQRWKCLNMNTGEINYLTTADQKFSWEIHDVPTAPNAYGIAFWTAEDERVAIYDRYDIWLFDPTGEDETVRLTDGRTDKIVYRYIDLNKDENFVSRDDKILLKLFDETDKSSGYALLDLKKNKLKQIIKEDYQYTRNVRKAKNSNDVVYTKENFVHFPNLIHSKLPSLDRQSVFTDLNPQQEDYNWGTIELFEWTDEDQEDMTGMLVKPENFDPGKKYPVIVNFYEKSSNGLHRHRHPFPHRSTINYSYYTSRGYIIFNPDVHYEIGYPGASALKAVVSGVEALKKYSWIDPARIGLQGHSWGGYQIAHITTKTDMFACAEAGAPVVNMVSAYGGIRWGSGLSRMFQYEKTQSRLGATLWEDPELYLENSPIFNVDKVNTPTLILHNDKDGAVPWYQGIEYFVALRRLQKPAWLLNYNKEPHWPLKIQNRLDFNRRMQQFFDHYLMDEPMPDWMKYGIPYQQKGIQDGFGTDG